MKYRGLFIGLSTIDIQYFVEEYPPANIKIKTNAPQLLVGGPAANAAVTFSHLNNGADLLTAIGDNPFTNYFLSDFRETNIRHLDIIDGHKNKPVLASIITSKNGERNIFTNNPQVIKPVISAENIFRETNPEIVLLDGFYPEVAIDCAKIAKSKNIPVVLDCGSWKKQYEKLLPYADIAICSADFYPPNCVNNDQIFSYFINRKIANFAISQGDKKLIYYDKNTKGNIPVKEVKVADTLGAGDVLHGAFCYYYLNMYDFKGALKKASEIATLSCKYKGTRSWLNCI